MTPSKPMRLLVTDRESIEAGLPVGARHVVISVRDAKRRKARVRRMPGLIDVLFVAFDDAEPTPSLVLPFEVKLMQPKHAEAIWAFVLEHRASADVLVVHCEQGMSRSPAIAAALAKGFGQDDARFWAEYAPNRHVYETMLGAQPGLGWRPASPQ